MAYTDVISLDNAKDYLGIDDTSRDTEINRMISSALSFVEQHSNHIMVSVNKKYYYREDLARVYDFPITAVVSPDPDTTTVYTFAGYSEYVDSNTSNTYVELTVGYADPADIPAPLVEAGYMIIEHLFNQKETGNSQIPQAAIQMIHSFKRRVL